MEKKILKQFKDIYNRTINVIENKFELNKAYTFWLILLVIPSIIYIIRSGSLFNFKYENTILLNDTNYAFQALVFFILFLFIFLNYLLLIKNYQKYFKNLKSIILFIIIISFLFILMVPFLSADIFYYIGIGRLWSSYLQNPYYVSIYDFISNFGIKEFVSDIAILNGFYNIWSDTTVVYGPIWTLLCGILAKFSFGNLELGVIVFKIFNVIIHIFNCLIIYKLSKNEKFVLIYGINPFVLLETIGNVHNDIILVCFALLAIYFITNKRNIYLSLLFLALSVNIKFVTVLLLPILVINYLKEKDLKGRIIGCIKYGLIFVIIYILPYFIFFKDMTIFKCMLVQNTKYARSLYLVINQIAKTKKISQIIQPIFLAIFAIIYIYYCIKLLLKKEIELSKEMRTFFMLIISFILLILTNFQTWYLMWLYIPFIWQEKENINFMIAIQFLSIITQTVYIKGGANYATDMVFYFSFTTLYICFYLFIALNQKSINNKGTL